MYIRKTRDEWGVYGLYGGEWGLECLAENMKDARRLLKEYEDNCPSVSFKIKHTRVKISDEEYESLKKSAKSASVR